MSEQTPRTVKFSSPQDPKSWEPGTDFGNVITCISNGDAKKAEGLFNALSSEAETLCSKLATAQAKLAALESDITRHVQIATEQANELETEREKLEKERTGNEQQIALWRHDLYAERKAREEAERRTADYRRLLSMPYDGALDVLLRRAEAAERRVKELEQQK